MQGELAQVQWVSLHMQGASFPLHPLPPCPNPTTYPRVRMVEERKLWSQTTPKQNTTWLCQDGLANKGILLVSIEAANIQPLKFSFRPTPSSNRINA